MLSVKILVEGQRLDGKRFSEETETSVVNAPGALILLAEQVILGQTLSIRNLKSHQELQAEVVDVGTVTKTNSKWALSSSSLPRVFGASDFLPKTGARTAPKPNVALSPRSSPR